MKQIDWKAVNEDIKKMSDEVLALALPYAKPTLDDMKAKEEEAKKITDEFNIAWKNADVNLNINEF